MPVIIGWAFFIAGLSSSTKVGAMSAGAFPLTCMPCVLMPPYSNRNCRHLILLYQLLTCYWLLVILLPICGCEDIRPILAKLRVEHAWDYPCTRTRLLFQRVMLIGCHLYYTRKNNRDIFTHTRCKVWCIYHHIKSLSIEPIHECVHMLV